MRNRDFGAVSWPKLALASCLALAVVAASSAFEARNGAELDPTAHSPDDVAELKTKLEKVGQDLKKISEKVAKLQGAPAAEAAKGKPASKKSTADQPASSKAAIPARDAVLKVLKEKVKKDVGEFAVLTQKYNDLLESFNADLNALRDATTDLDQSFRSLLEARRNSEDAKRKQLPE